MEIPMTRTRSTYGFALLVVLLAALSGCQSGGDKTEGPTAASAAPASGAAASTNGQGDEVVPADYEQKVEGEITSTNYKTELEKLAADAN
jgi:hypothetical protein